MYCIYTILLKGLGRFECADFCRHRLRDS
eukprot:COSAG06_NODE_67772_length_251_cov_0.664474_1_plen_28_part_01